MRLSPHSSADLSGEIADSRSISSEIDTPGVRLLASVGVHFIVELLRSAF